MTIKPYVRALFALALFIAAALLSQASARGEDLPSFEYNPQFIVEEGSAPLEDGDLIQELIRDQLAAIRKRDADAAYSTLGETLHDKFDSAKKFLARMRFDYSPLYNHESYSFLESHSLANGDIIQKVKIHDRYTDDPALVIYRIKLDIEGHWVIDSFTIIDEEATPI